MRLDITRLVATPSAPHRRYLPVPGADSAEESTRPRGLYEGEPENCRRDLSQFLPVLLHLGLLLAVVEVYRLDHRLTSVLWVALAALPVHYLLPHRWKKPFFTAASIVGLGVVFGWSVAAAVLPMAAVLIAIAAAPIGWRWKAGLIGLAAAGLAIARSGLASIVPELPPGTWPVLGSMLMFRMIIYLYEMKHARKPESIADTVGYFFLLPNWCFLHFPVVDYRTWLRGYFAADVHALQRRGLKMMLRGVTHLLAYRLVYHEVLITPEEVVGGLSLLRYLGANYLLYLHVSGQFHVACGMLHLFGYQLPETHHHFLMATGFTDYWRRINIYWKDFMVRVVFNPVVFRLKKRPQAVSLAVATVVVFAATWFLHAYQSFWLGGHWGFSAPDALFWGILGALVLVNVQLDARRGRVTPPKDRLGRIRALGLRGAKIVGTLGTIALLWSLWTSEGVGPWLEMLRRGVFGVEV